ncbi:PAS domain S-box protein [Chromobacterium sp. IIBBL 290-4]|uniref:PAS domain S-box protein n=1 Tax=Chromobacterium sp. IIBBL 290-4 TaxID=2953890 RepID=UPI0020B64FA4|nr:PAS domain S-box protein [Chromobacterium sp. IIBBL 290-4]UTH73893.1 PAS domain S-box protein [Chromobacterium sp. IIBBL 290-4]
MERAGGAGRFFSRFDLPTEGAWGAAAVLLMTLPPAWAMGVSQQAAPLWLGNALLIWRGRSARLPWWWPICLWLGCLPLGWLNGSLMALANALQVALGVWLLRRRAADPRRDVDDAALIATRAADGALAFAPGAVLLAMAADGVGAMQWLSGGLTASLLGWVWLAGRSAETEGGGVRLILILLMAAGMSAMWRIDANWCLAALALPFLCAILLLPAGKTRLCLLLLATGHGLLFSAPAFSQAAHALPQPLPWLQLLSASLAALLAHAAHHARSQSRAAQLGDDCLRNSLEGQISGCALLDGDGRIRESNAYLCDLLGWQAEELIGLPYECLCHPADASLWTQCRALALEGAGAPVPMELRLQRSDGEIVWCGMQIGLYSQLGEENGLRVYVCELGERMAERGRLSELSEMLSLATSAAGMGLWEWDVKRQVLHCDGKMRRLNGMADEESDFIAKLWPRLRPEDAAAWRRLLELRWPASGSAGWDYQVADGADGGRTLRLVGQIRYDEYQQPQSVVGLCWDISDEVEMRRMLSDARERLQAVLDNVPAMVGCWNRQTVNQFANRGYLDWFGLAPGQVEGRLMSDVLGMEVYRGVQHQVWRALQGEPVLFEHSVPDAQGKERHTLASYVPYREEGEVAGFYAFETDITPLKMARREQRQVQARLQSIVDSASEFAILAMDLKGGVTVFSVGAEKMLGYRAEAMVEQGALLSLLDQEELDGRRTESGAAAGEALDVFWGSARQAGAVEGEWTFVRQDGGKVPVYAVVNGIWRDGGLQGFICIAKDVSREREARQALERAKDAAEVASRAKSEFVANVSHEIRTPMNGVQGMLHLMASTPLSTTQRKYLDMIQASCRALMSILNDILDFSKMEAGRFEVASEPFALDEVLDALAAIMSMNGASKNLALAIDVEPDAPMALQGDALRLQQVLVNLACNAIKFTEQGAVAVSVRVQGHGDERALRFEVADTGVGMSEAQLQTLFSAFSQADSSTTRRFGGTGLGLVISRRLVGLMGGQMAVESRQGSGSRFWFTLPVHEAAAASPLDNGACERLLLIEGHPACAAAMANHARRLACGVEACASSQSAMRWLESERCDGVLIDWSLSGVDGAALCRDLRERWPERALRLIAVVNASQRDRLDRAVELNWVDAVLTRPVTAPALAEALRQAGLHCQSFGERGAALAETRPPQLGSHLVLLVDDNEINLQVAGGMLQLAGLRVEMAANGRQAVDILRQRGGEFSLVLMDMQMPEMDGDAAAGVIRRELRLSLPIVAMSAGVSPSEQLHCLDAGMSDFIAKPVQADKLYPVLAKYLHAAAVPAEADARQEEAGIFSVELMRLAASSDNARSRVGKMMQLLVDNSDRQLDQIREALGAGGHEDVARQVHALRGSVGSFGALGLVAMLQELEREVLRGDLVQCEQLLANAQRELDKVTDAAKAWLSQHAS